MWRKNRRVRSINFFKAPCNYYQNASWNIWRLLKVTILKHAGGFQYSYKICGLVRLWSSCNKNQGLIRRLSLIVQQSVYIYLLKLVLAWCRSYFSVVIMLASYAMNCEVDFIPLECPDCLNVNILGILVAC